MGVYPQYHSKKSPNSSSTRLLHLTIPSTSNFLYDKSDFIWNHPTELDLTQMKKASLMTTMEENHFLKVLPSIRRLYTAFNSICPHIYRIHCSDSFRTLQELICLIEEYLHLRPSLTNSIKELLSHEEYLDDFIDQLRHLPRNNFYPNIYSPSRKPEIRCFGQGIHACNSNNQLHEKTLFCFELTTSTDQQFSFPIDVLILDPHENLVSNEIKYISTYDRGHTKLYSCSYQPISKAGQYQISFLYNHQPLTNNAFTVFIRNSNDEKDRKKKSFGQGKDICFLSDKHY